jgi:hypothetical protein
MNKEPLIPGGYVLKARKILESKIMNKPPLYSKLWDWMLLKANHVDGYKGLKRGQFFTKISDMQEAMSWYAGWRKITPSRDEIRNCYEAFREATMITTAKTTRGFKITICNYDKYQNPENYEYHRETHNEKVTNPPATPHYKQECKQECNKNDNKTFSSDSIEIRLSKLLFELISKNMPNPKKPNFQTWAKNIDLAIRIDKRKPEELEKIIRWSQQDDFWHKNILSTGSLRKKFDQLWLKSQGRKEGTIGHSGSTEYSGIGKKFTTE